MYKKKMHHFWVKIRPLSYWYFLLAFVVSLSISVTALRNNNLEMVRLRDAVTKTDEEDGDVEAALRQLRTHVYSHMNTNLSSGSTAIKPPIQLKHRYERLLNAEQERVAAANSKIYTDAQASCEARFPASASGGGRVPCIAEYVSANGEQPRAIADSLYKFDFVSPLWTPDLAGWSLVISTVLLLLFIVRLAFEKWARAVLQPHN